MNMAQHFQIKLLSKLPSIYFKAFNVLFVIIVLIICILLTRFFRFKKHKFIACLLIVCILFLGLGSIYSINTIKVHVPQSNKTLCAHIEGNKVYVFGLLGIEDYLKRNAPIIDYLFLLNKDDVKALDNLPVSIKINKIYDSLSGNIKNVWQEAHDFFEFISKQKYNINLDNTIKFIGDKSSQDNLASARLALLSNQYKITEPVK